MGYNDEDGLGPEGYMPGEGSESINDPSLQDALIRP